MIVIDQKQARIIHANTASEFESELNECLESLAKSGLKHEISFNNNMGFCAYVLFSETKRIPESLADEYIIRGEKYYCADCVHCDYVGKDRRLRYFPCAIHHKEVRLDAGCCEEFYVALDAGEDIMRKGFGK